MACDPLDHTSIYNRIIEDSDESDGEGSLGNVNRVIMRPPGHSGKAKRGHLCFDASFETGNLGRVDLINEYEYDLFIRPDTCSPKLRFWFNFTVDNVKQDQRVLFNIVNVSKGRNLFNSNMTPIVKSTTRPKWQRIPKRNVFYYRSPVHRNNYVLSFLFAFDREDEIFQFALAHPYSYSRLQSFLTNLESRAAYLDRSFKRELLGNSVQKRRLELITIGQHKSNEKQRVIVIIARVHPGESPGSFVCQGLLEFLTSSHALPNLLREHVVFKIIPMLNPDGVFLGNYRSTVMGFDLNRSWHIASPWGHPTLKAVIDLIDSIDKNKDFQLDHIVDIHAHSSLTGCFVYGNSYEDVYRYERHIVFPKILATVTDDYIQSNTMFNADVNKISTARRYFCTILGSHVNCYTFEVSLFGYKLKGSEVVIPYNEDSYMRCGRNLIRAFLEYYKAIGIIPLELPSVIKKKRPKTHRPRSITRIYAQRPNTTRSQASVHFKDININYDSETSADEYPYSYRYYKSPTRTSDRLLEHDRYLKKIGGGGITNESGVISPPPTTYVVIPEPSLSVIDFNIITRHSLEEACKRNKRIF